MARQIKIRLTVSRQNKRIAASSITTREEGGVVVDGWIDGETEQHRQLVVLCHLYAAHLYADGSPRLLRGITQLIKQLDPGAEVELASRPSGARDLGSDDRDLPF